MVTDKGDLLIIITLASGKLSNKKGIDLLIQILPDLLEKIDHVIMESEKYEYTEITKILERWKEIV